MERENEQDDLELFARLTVEKRRNSLVQNSVKGKQTGPVTTFEVDKNPVRPTIQKRRVSKSTLKRARMALVCGAVGCIALAAGMVGMKIEDHRTYLSAQESIIEELEQDINGVLPSEKEERQAVYGMVAKDFNLDLSNKKDQEFLVYLMVVGTPDNEQAKTNFDQILADYGYSTPQSFYASRGYFYEGQDGINYPSGKVYENYMETRLDEHVESVQAFEEGVKKH